LKARKERVAAEKAFLEELAADASKAN